MTLTHHGNGVCVGITDHRAEVQRLEAKVAALEAENGRLRVALAQFVDHFGDPFRNARAALAEKEPK